jgi:hypothetical protein
MRTFPIWTASTYGPYIVGCLGATTALLSTLIGHAQSNIKGQIAYASSAQVGLIFVELAFGWEGFALFHLSGNAFLRCFQLLISPSIIAFVLRWQGSGGGGVRAGWWPSSLKLSGRAATTLYVFCLNEGYLEDAVRWVLWNPVRGIGVAVARLASGPGAFTPLVVLVGIGLSVAVPAGREWGAGVLVTHRDINKTFLKVWSIWTLMKVFFTQKDNVCVCVFLVCQTHQQRLEISPDTAGMVRPM